MKIFSGLLFNKISDSCDYSRNVICNKKSDKSSTTTTTTAKTSTALVTKSGSTTTTTTTTTTTEAIPEEEYVDAQEDTDSQEDPKAIKQLITLIKKLGLWFIQYTNYISKLILFSKYEIVLNERKSESMRTIEFFPFTGNSLINSRIVYWRIII